MPFTTWPGCFCPAYPCTYKESPSIHLPRASIDSLVRAPLRSPRPAVPTLFQPCAVTLSRQHAQSANVRWLCEENKTSMRNHSGWCGYKHVVCSSFLSALFRRATLSLTQERLANPRSEPQQVWSKPSERCRHYEGAQTLDMFGRNAGPRQSCITGRLNCVIGIRGRTSLQKWCGGECRTNGRTWRLGCVGRVPYSEVRSRQFRRLRKVIALPCMLRACSRANVPVNVSRHFLRLLLSARKAHAVHILPQVNLCARKSRV